MIALAELINAPIGHSLRGKEFIQYDNPYDIGMTGLLGYGAAAEGIEDADLLILLGTDFPYDQFLPGTRTAQVDRAAHRLGRRTDVDIAVHGDVLPTLAALMPLVQAKKSRRFLDEMLKKHDRLMNKAVGAYTRKVETNEPIHPEYAASLLDQVAADDAIFTADTGMCNVWAARYINPLGTRRLIGSFLHGSMANALPHAIGAQLAYPGRQVVSVSGDGGLSMLLGELITVAAHRLPVNMVVFNNSTLGMVKLEMLVDGLPDFGVDVPDANYAAVARALGFHAVRVTRSGPDRGRLPRGLRPPGPVAGGADHRSQGALAPAEDHRRAGPGLRHRHVQGGAQPGRRRGRQHGAEQPAEHPAALSGAGCEGAPGFGAAQDSREARRRSARTRTKGEGALGAAGLGRAQTVTGPASTRAAVAG